MKLKVGSKVRLVPNCPLHHYVDDIIHLFHKTTVITNIVDDRYRIQLDNGFYLWEETELILLDRLHKLKRLLK